MHQHAQGRAREWRRKKGRGVGAPTQLEGGGCKGQIDAPIRHVSSKTSMARNYSGLAWTFWENRTPTPRRDYDFPSVHLKFFSSFFFV